MKKRLRKKRLKQLILREVPFLDREGERIGTAKNFKDDKGMITCDLELKKTGQRCGKTLAITFEAIYSKQINSAEADKP